MAEDRFHHPYRPYDIQIEFMQRLYHCIEEGKVGIFESPTDQNEPAWVLEHANSEKRRKAFQARKEREERLERIRVKEARLKQKYIDDGPFVKRRKINDASANTHKHDEETQFELDEYHSDDGRSLAKKAPSYQDGFSSETQALLKKAGMLIESKFEEEEVADEIKVIYCSRTHSQLTQFADELRKVKLPPSLESESDDFVTKVEDSTEQLRHLTLGSRKNLCINPKVNRLSSVTAINERCLELQKPGTSADNKCQYIPSKDDQAVVIDFRDGAMAKIRDIEDLGQMGKQMGICPYYASRSAIKPSEVVTLPYPLLLQRSAREALDLSLKGHVVIIDEAHNLMDAIAGLYSADVTLVQLQRAKSQLMIYLQKFRSRLKGKNRVYVAQVVRLLDALIHIMKSEYLDGRGPSEKVITSVQLMCGKGVDQINVFKLAAYLQESKLARKVDGYLDHAAQSEPKTSTDGYSAGDRSKSSREANSPVLTQVQGFLICLMNPSTEGRFFLSRDETGAISLRYMLLDPSAHFREIVEDARAVVLAGGTMSPMEDYTNHLFPYLNPDRISTLSCGHVIPSTNLIAWPIKHAADRTIFDFTFDKRSSVPMIAAAGRLLLNLARVIPDGLVAFFPSYAYLATCVDTWKQTSFDGTSSPSIWDALCACKSVFAEASRSARIEEQHRHKADRHQQSLSSDKLLAAYSEVILGSPEPRGALLLSVINGSLSEGINFSDRLGRGVVVFGLPFPNPHSAAWKAKSAYIAEKTANHLLSSERPMTQTEAEVAGKSAARDFYENATMRAVNQAVGRAIRHQNDYAAILLVDRRYETERIRKKLPSWIQDSLRTGAGVLEVQQGLQWFFKNKSQ